MAKKYFGKNLKRVYKNTDNWVIYGYKYGVWQSTIIHTFVLLLLSLIVITDNPVSSIKLSLSFDDPQQSPEIADVIDIAITEEMAHQNVQNDFETIPINDINDKISDIDLEFSVEEKYTDTDPELSELTKVIVSAIDTKSDFPKEYSIESDPDTNLDIEKLMPGVFSNSSSSRRYTGSLLDGHRVNNGSENADIDHRLKQAGAKTGDIQVSIGWDTIDDIDLHVLFRNQFGKSYICWSSRIGVNNGMLDVDMNADPTSLTNRPVENIFWPHGRSPEGEYSIGIHNFKNWSGNPATQVTIVIKTTSFTKTLKAIAVYGQPTKETFRFSNP